MSLQILTGSAGVGKTTRLYQGILRSAQAEPNRRHVVLVPEQFSMETQRRLVEMHPGHAILNIDVLSFERLAWRVLAEQGMSGCRVLDEAGKGMLLRRAAGQHGKELTVFRRNLSRAGFIHRMKSMMSELMQYGVQPSDLERLADETEAHSLLSAKLRDLEIFYEAFLGNLEEGTIPAEELPSLLLRELPRSGYLRDASVALDGFAGFTPVQYRILGEIFRQAKETAVTLTLPEGEDLSVSAPEHALFARTRETARSLLVIAEEIGVPAEIRVCPPDPAIPAKPADLGHLERHFLRYGPDSRYPGKPERIRLLAARNPAEEVRGAVHEILRLVREEGLRYREIAVVTGDLEGYRPLLAKEFAEAGIPFFMDRKKGVMDNPLVTFLRSAMEAVEKGFTYETVFRYLKSGLANLAREQTDLLENYVLAAGIKGVGKWQQPWDRTVPGREDLNLEELNALREMASAPLLRLREAALAKPRRLKNATAGLRALMEEADTAGQLAAMSETWEAEGEYAKADEYARITEAVLDLLDEADRLLGEETLSLAELGDILDAGLSELQLGMIPPCLDQLTIGDIERSRLSGLRVLIFLGLNEGIVPKPETAGGILSDEEREILRDHRVELAPTNRENGYRECFSLYELLTKPTRELVLSFSRMSGDGKSLAPSYYLTQLHRIFPELAEEELPAIPAIDSLSAAGEAMAASAGRLREEEPEDWWKELYCRMAEEPSESERLNRILDACFFRYEGSPLSRAAAKQLYGDTIYGSVTRLEQYAACAYAQFLSYGLGLTERAEYEFDQRDRGNFFHRALEMIFREMREQGISPKEITEEQRRTLVDSGIRAAAENVGSTILTDTAHNAYYLERWRKMTDRTVWAICDQLAQSDFLPEAFELHFDGSRSAALNLALGDDRRMILHGVVDRMDLCEDGDRIYVKIVDYKTGGTTFDLNRVYQGLQLQLVVYLDAVMEQEERRHPDREVIPAGIYYYHIADPNIEGTAPLAPERLEAEMRKKLQLTGVTNSGNHVSDHMEKTAGVSVTPEQFALLRRHVRRRSAEFGRGILDGEIGVVPYKNKKGCACDYCAFASVCGFDAKLPGYRYRRLTEEPEEKIWQKISEEV